MSDTLKIRKVGNSLGVILNKDLVDALGVKEGDAVYAVRTPDGVRLMPYDPGFQQRMEKAEEIMARYRNALRELAK